MVLAYQLGRRVRDIEEFGIHYNLRITSNDVGIPAPVIVVQLSIGSYPGE
jgi:hypothetical protein